MIFLAKNNYNIIHIIITLLHIPESRIIGRIIILSVRGNKFYLVGGG